MRTKYYKGYLGDYQGYLDYQAVIYKERDDDRNSNKHNRDSNKHNRDYDGNSNKNPWDN